MIKLELPEKPAELTPEKERELVEKFKADGSAVWKKSYITKPLLAMTNNKCAYSEQALNQESAYMEVDHFKHKNLYQDEVAGEPDQIDSVRMRTETYLFGSIVYSYLNESPVMRKLEERLQALDQWDEELEAIRRELESIALPSPD